MMYLVWDLDITTSYHWIDRDFCTSLAPGYLAFVTIDGFVSSAARSSAGFAFTRVVS
jgi:hypothetical protein